MDEQKPVVVDNEQGVIDGLQAAARYITVLVTMFIALAGLIGTRDFAGIAAYVQQNFGDVVSAVAGLIGLATAAYGVFKTGKRGTQIATVAADPRVPDDVAKTA